MARRLYLLAACAAAIATSASAQVTVLGTGMARSCYDAARSGARPTAEILNRCDGAIRDEALSRDDLVATHVNRGILRIRNGDVRQGMADFDIAIELNPRQSEASYNKGIVLLNSGATAEALRLFESALEARPRRPELAYYGRGLSNEMLGNIRAAYRDYRQAAQINPRWAEPRAQLERFQVSPR